MAVTLRLRAWRFLRSQPAGAAPRDVAAALGITPHYAANVLRALRDRGAVVATGNTWNRVYTATGRVPTDNRGRTAGTAMNLAKGRIMGLHAIAAKRGRAFVPRPRHALDAAWGFTAPASSGR
jgi:hypothetical protein